MRACRWAWGRACRRPAATTMPVRYRRTDRAMRSPAPAIARVYSSGPGLEPLPRGAQREGNGRRPVAGAYRSGGAIHPFEGALSPDRVPASARALELARFEPAAGAAGSLREQHRARRRQLRGDRLRRCGHTVGRTFTDDVQHAAALPCRDVDRLAEVARQPARGRRDFLEVPARGQFRPRESQRSPAELVAPARQPLRQPDTGQLSQQRVGGDLAIPSSSATSVGPQSGRSTEKSSSTKAALWTLAGME